MKNKIITLSLVGYNHPSQANWSYSIFKIDLIDLKSPFAYQMSYTVKSAFGGEARFKSKFQRHNIIETKGIYTTTGTPKITGVTKMLDIESKELEILINEFINKK